MATDTLKQELLGLEKQFWQAMKDKDADAAARLSAEPAIVTGPQGVGLLDRKALAGMIKDSPWTLREFELKEDAQVLQVSDDVAIVAYKVHEELTVDGKPVSLDAADSSTWVRRDGRWVCALHTEAITGDPFGRDRKAAPPRG